MPQCYDGKIILGLMYVVVVALFIKDRLVNNELLQVQRVKTQSKTKEKTETQAERMYKKR